MQRGGSWPGSTRQSGASGCLAPARSSRTPLPGSGGGRPTLPPPGHRSAASQCVDSKQSNFSSISVEPCITLPQERSPPSFRNPSKETQCCHRGHRLDTACQTAGARAPEPPPPPRGPAGRAALPDLRQGCPTPPGAGRTSQFTQTSSCSTSCLPCWPCCRHSSRTGRRGGGCSLLWGCGCSRGSLTQALEGALPPAAGTPGQRQDSGSWDHLPKLLSPAALLPSSQASPRAGSQAEQPRVQRYSKPSRGAGRTAKKGPGSQPGSLLKVHTAASGEHTPEPPGLPRPSHTHSSQVAPATGPSEARACGPPATGITP